ncbi:hypothetical protein AZE42_02747 [Rhizopogon vesiculosus]|uniref:Uncharacterized protein n=1 Tax=Rhizopogon vesiculosus TaxID=180088 RepID=A0A1J8Q2D4_9AGAM|nr:hypothetical protein AZE42_02747 [Rhizopogon vesiculosus]
MLMLVKHISEESAVPSPPDNPPVNWTPLRHGMKSDWGSAADCNDDEDKEHLQHTGTLPFELNQSLKGEPVEYHHDLQSYFWLAYLIICNCAGPFNMCRDWRKEMEKSALGGPITTSLINNLTEIKTQGRDWKKVATDHALHSKSPSAGPEASAGIPVNYKVSWIKTQGGDWKKVAMDHTLHSKSPSAGPEASAGIPVNYKVSWVHPGVHTLTPEDIVNQREQMSYEMEC